VHLGFETLVSTTLEGAAGTLGEPIFFEERAAAEFCVEPRSVAEVAAELGIPVGVSRVVLGDLAERRIIVVHRPGDVGDPALILRILDALSDY
jgi:hypothetical protein